MESFKIGRENRATLNVDLTTAIDEHFHYMGMGDHTIKVPCICTNEYVCVMCNKSKDLWVERGDRGLAIHHARRTTTTFTVTVIDDPSDQTNNGKKFKLVVGRGLLKKIAAVSAKYNDVVLHLLNTPKGFGSRTFPDYSNSTISIPKETITNQLAMDLFEATEGEL